MIGMISQPLTPLSKFTKKFGKEHVVLPVIHIATESQVFRNVEIAKKAGASGVWLINHTQDGSESCTIENMFDWASKIRKEHELWSGINLLGTPVWQTIIWAQREYTQGVWNDNAGAIETDDNISFMVDNAQVRRKYKGLYFGGVAFKYQKPVKDLEFVTRQSTALVDVITTSGDGTGIAADIDKIKRMYDYAEGHPLAIASGITPENIDDYLPYVNAFLVATGVSRDFYNFDLDKLKSVVESVDVFNM